MSIENINIEQNQSNNLNIERQRLLDVINQRQETLRERLHQFFYHHPDKYVNMRGMNGELLNSKKES